MVESRQNIVPMITVAMPVYNGGEYLRSAVLSIIGQTFTDWELFIIDDGSTDHALDDLRDIIAADNRIRVFCDGANKGLAARLNECIDMARGRYLARMDQDDVSYPTRFAKQIQMLESDTTFDLVVVRAITIDENNMSISLLPSALTHDEICAKPWRGFYQPHPTWMGKIEWFRKFRYTVPGPYFCEDQELLLRSYRDSHLGAVDEVLFAYRVRGQVDQRKLAKTRSTILKIQLAHFARSLQWHYWLLAVAAYLGKTADDLLKRIGIESIFSERKVVDDGLRLKWGAVLNDLQAVVER